VIERLRRDADLDAGAVEVETQNGVVLLSGAVTSAAARETASRAARDVPAVRDVCNLLIVRPAPGEAGRSSDESPAARAVPSAFDDIAAHLVEQDPSLGRTRWSTAGPAVRVAVVVLAGLLWSLISIVMVVLGWVAVLLVSCAVASIVVNVASHRRTDRERAHGLFGRTRRALFRRPRSGRTEQRRQT
jgi:hypothetical protein